MNSKKIAILMAMLLLVSLFAGCSSKPAASGGTAAAPAKATNFPTKPIQLIIPWPAGGASDLSTRMIAKFAEKELGQAISPVNKDGANGATAWAEAVTAKPDGYTIVMVTFDILTNQILGRSPVKYNDYDYLLQFTSQPVAFIVPGDSPYKTLEDLLKAGKEKPGTITVATTPLGGFYHQALGLVEKSSGAKFKPVPLAGSAEVNTALLGKQVDVGINTLPLLDQHVKSGAFRLLAVSSEKRIERFPDIPTLIELNRGIAYESFRAIAVPKNVPADVKAKLTDAFTKAYNNPEFQDAAIKAKHDISYRSPADFGKFVDALYPKVDSVLTDLGIKK